jgi:MFS family permease
MFGGVAGAVFWPRWLAGASGFQSLPAIILPILVFAGLVQYGLSGLPAVKARNLAVVDLHEVRGNWRNVLILYASSSMRYCVNTALIYLFVRWSQQMTAAKYPQLDEAAVAALAAPTAGNLNAAMILGMACGGFLAGTLVAPDREKGPLVWVPLVFAPMVALFPRFGIEVSYLMALLAGIGFSSMIPISIALAQHLLPHRANFAASLMMGGAWMVATIGPRSAEYGVSHFGLNNTFLLIACLLACSGLVCTLLKPPRLPAQR